jgi:hypothetical protein
MFWLANDTLEGANDTCGTPTPVPLSAPLLGDPVALSETETEAERAPAEVGVKAIEIVQLAPTATLVPQLFVSLKSAALVPVTAMPVIESAAVPVLDTVSLWAALVVPMFWLANDTLEGASDICGTPTPVPLSAAL